ncbi:MAG: hypothetical protein JWO13_123 [Acidobacteriales bacterium]|nr:hypothetical protein [Terriglobales bacterium]
MESGFQCAGCGEWNDTVIDHTGGFQQQYVEDCQVCCKPNVLRVSFNPDIEQFIITAELE